MVHMKTSTIAKIALPFVALVAVACSKPAAKADQQQPAAASEATSSVVAVTVGSKGFQPSSINAKKGQKLTLRFTRTTDATCAKAVAFPELGIKKALPLNQPVDIVVPTAEARKLTFQCGMGMFKSAVLVR